MKTVLNWLLTGAAFLVASALFVLVIVGIGLLSVELAFIAFMFMSMGVLVAVEPSLGPVISDILWWWVFWTLVGGGGGRRE